MRVLITGGSGFIGRALTASLARDEHEVIVLSRRPQALAGLPPGARAVGWDGRSAGGWGELASGAGAIVNLAGQSIAGESLFPILLQRWTNAYKRGIRESRLRAGAAVVQAALAAERKPGVVIQASAVGYYGPQPDLPPTEASGPGSDFLAGICAAWEATTAPVEAAGVRRAVVRTGIALHPGGGVLPLVMLPFRFFVGGRLGSGRQWFPWIHLEDELRAIRFLIENPEARGAFNLTAPNPLTNAEFARALGRVMRRPAALPIPAFALRLLLGEKATIVLDGQRPPPARLQQMGFEFRFPEAEGALRDLLR